MKELNKSLFSQSQHKSKQRCYTVLFLLVVVVGVSVWMFICSESPLVITVEECGVDVSTWNNSRDESNNENKVEGSKVKLGEE